MRFPKGAIDMRGKVQKQALELMARYGGCELLLIGLAEVGLLGSKEWYWDCELYRVGLRELGLA
jgi:hypothetical protein